MKNDAFDPKTQNPSIFKPIQKPVRIHFIKVLTLALSVFFLFIALFVFPHTKLGTRVTVALWENKLTELINTHLTTANPEAATFLGYHIVCHPDTDSIFFDQKSMLFPYRGFYYSVSGAPVGFQGANITYEKSGKGWIYREINGDNWMYVEKISEKWYWYKMHF